MNLNHLLDAALAARSHLNLPTLRLFDGAGDGCPRLAIDQYTTPDGERLYRAHGPPVAIEYLPVLKDRFGTSLYWRFGHTEQGGADEGERTIIEGGLRYQMRLQGPRSPGLFLDARDARAWVRGHATDRRILNLFAYTCGFGLCAAAGGARSTTNVDIAPAVLKRGLTNYQANDLPTDGRTFWKSDAIDALRRSKRNGAQFDGIILDPPPVQHRRKKGRSWDPETHLSRLLNAARPVLAPHGWLLVLSAHRGTSDQMLIDMADLGDPLWRGAHGPDYRPIAGTPGLRAFAFSYPDK